MTDTLLNISGLKTWIDVEPAPVRAVDGIDLEIRRGETFAVVGESGCGKSMTALSILRLLPETAEIVAGSAQLGGTELFGLAERDMRDVRGRRIAMIFQEPSTSLNPVLTVGAQVQEVLRRHGRLSPQVARKRIIELLDQVGIPDAERRAGEYPFQLSGGMKQRVMVAMALAGDPDLLIADEPTTALDVTIQAQVLDLLRKLQRERGMSILLITHDLGIVASMAHRVAVMYAGRIVEVADRKQFFSAPQHPYSRKLFEALPGTEGRGGTLAVIRGQVPPLTAAFQGCRFADRCDFVYERCAQGEPELTPVATELGEHRIRCVHVAEKGRFPAREQSVALADDALAVGAPAAAAPLLIVRDLKVHFPIRKGLLKRTVAYVKAVDGLSLDIAAGRTLALVGESGCGKTTAGKAILQLIRPTAGSVQFQGAELTALRGEAMRAHRSAIQIIFQDPYASLNPRMRVGDILAEGLLALGMADGSAAQHAANDLVQKRVNELLDQVGLPKEAQRRYPHEFSGGQRQRIAIARALAVKPRLIVCDEPTSALDVSVQAQILNLLKTLQAELGLSYLFITHNLAVVEFLAHEVAVMYLGRIIERGTVDEVLRVPAHPYTQALLAAVPRIEKEMESEIGGGESAVAAQQVEMPSPVNAPAGCHFHPRCASATDECRREYPGTVTMTSEHVVNCWKYPITK